MKPAIPKKKLIFAAAAALLILAILAIVLIKKTKPGPDPDEIERGRKILAGDYFRGPGEVRYNIKDIKQFFSNDIANENTIGFFEFLRRKFGKADIDEHLEAVKRYLYSIMYHGKADETLALYRKYLDYLEQLDEFNRRFSMPKDYDDLMYYLKEIRSFRREFFGKGTADALFGKEEKRLEYHVRNNSVISDRELYGAEKERRLAAIRKETWGDTDPGDGDARPYDRYVEKKKIYERDLGEMQDDARQEKIKEFRKEFFPPDVIARLEKVDRIIRDDREKEKEYRKQESAINNDNSLSDKQREAGIRNLQKRIFGAGADEFRRAEEMRRLTEEYKKK
jgi:lipase chaperone LimK